MNSRKRISSKKQRVVASTSAVELCATPKPVPNRWLCRSVNVGSINGGFFVCDRKIFEYFSNCDQKCSFEHDILPKLLKDSQLMSFDHKDFWMPMDTNREYELLNKLWKKNPKNFL